MKAIAALVAGIAIAVVGIGALADATQDRPDFVKRDSRSTLVVEIETRRYRHSEMVAMETLWSACQGVVNSRVVDPGFEETAPGEFRFTVQPAIGNNSRKRITGCLEDATVDRIRGELVSLEP